jgi:tRNA(fMet)-specific endonuclease VapC
MSRLLLDTTYFIDAERAGNDLDAVIDDEDDVAVAAISIAELRVGALLASGRRRAAREAYVAAVAASVPVLGYDLGVAEAHAELLVAVRGQGKPRGAHDLIIAATARAFDREVVTADVGAFASLPRVAVRRHR